MNTLDISDKMVRSALKKEEASLTGALSPDRRGRQPPANKIPEERIAKVHEHLQLLPVVPPHLCRRDSKKTYIEGDLTLNLIYNKYVEWTQRHDLEPVKQAIYKREMDNLNIAVHQPRKDQCWCASHHRLVLSEQEEQTDKFNFHRRMIEEVRDEKTKDIEESRTLKDTQTLFFDLEAILFTPLLFGKPLFYTRKLATLNLTINETKNNKGNKSLNT